MRRSGKPPIQDCTESYELASISTAAVAATGVGRTNSIADPAGISGRSQLEQLHRLEGVLQGLPGMYVALMFQ
jgi:hypothetical protein